MDVLLVTHRPEQYAEAVRRLGSSVHARLARTGETARAAIASHRYAVLVADDDLPDQCAAAVFAEAQERLPSAYRVLVADTVRLVGVLRGHVAAHQIVSPRSIVAGLVTAVERAREFQEQVDDDRVRDLLGGFGELPPVPSGYQRIADVMTDPDASGDDVARAIEPSIAISAKVLQVVNSAMFGMPRRVTSVRQAVNSLGLRYVRALVLSSEASRAFPVERPVVGFSMAALERHSLLVASLARSMTSGADAQADAFTAGMLHDVGRLMLASRFPQKYSRVMMAAQQPGADLMALERRHLGVGHADLGAYLLSLWGLPDVVVEAVMYHHTPSAIPHSRPMTADVLHLAETLAHEAHPEPYPVGDLDMGHLGGPEVHRMLAMGRATMERLQAA